MINSKTFTLFFLFLKKTGMIYLESGAYKLRTKTRIRYYL